VIRRPALAVVVATVVLAFATAHADPGAEQRARTLYEAGTQHFNLGEYDQAIAAYKDAYRAYPNPAFLYNIAQAYRLDDQPRQALAFYKSFLNARPEASNAAEVEGFISELTAAVAKLDAAQRTPPTAVKIPTPAETAAKHPPPPSVLRDPEIDETPDPIYRKWWFWAGVSVVAVGASTLAITMATDSSPPNSDLGNFPAF
jgi:tetratricopeptide (TPR) repeat protein